MLSKSSVYAGFRYFQKSFDNTLEYRVRLHGQRSLKTSRKHTRMRLRRM